MADVSGLASAAELFKALSSASRLHLLTLLIERPRSVGELVAETGLSQPLVSQHLRVLRGAGLVDVERLGRDARYSIHDRHVAHIVEDAVAHAGEGVAAV